MLLLKFCFSIQICFANPSDSHTSNDYFKQGTALAEKGKFGEAIKYFNKFLTLNRTGAKARAESLGGSCSFGTAAGKDTSIIVNIPV